MKTGYLKDGPFRLHVVSLPWTNTDGQHVTCAYTAKVEKFVKMMMARGHEIFLYSGPENTTPCTEHIVAITAEEQAPILGTTDAPWNIDHRAWVAMNTRAAAEIALRALPGSTDLVLLISGAQKPIADALSWLTNCEFGIGYAGTFSANRVFESETWRHTVYGKEWGTGYDGPAHHEKYDCVIPNYFDPDDFTVREPDNPRYFLYLGRGIWRKGTQIAADVCRHLGQDLVLAGQEIEGWPDYGRQIGPVDRETRRRVLSGATALFVPTQYGEPFGGVAVEALMSGVPVITSDHGAFVETVGPGDGWRCRTMAEYVDAARAALREADQGELPTNSIDEELAYREAHSRTGMPLPQSTVNVRWVRRARAIERFSLDVIAVQYERFLGQLMELHGPGYRALEHWTWEQVETAKAGTN